MADLDFDDLHFSDSNVPLHLVRCNLKALRTTPQLPERVSLRRVPLSASVQPPGSWVQVVADTWLLDREGLARQLAAAWPRILSRLEATRVKVIDSAGASPELVNGELVFCGGVPARLLLLPSWEHEGIEWHPVSRNTGEDYNYLILWHHPRCGRPHLRTLFEAERQRRLNTLLDRFIAKWAPALGVQPAGYEVVSLRQMPNAWGCCTHDTRRIRFSVALAAYPPDFVEAVALHELAHLKHPGHSTDFQALVRSLMTDYDARLTLEHFYEI